MKIKVLPFSWTEVKDLFNILTEKYRYCYKVPVEILSIPLKPKSFEVSEVSLEAETLEANNSQTRGHREL